MNRKSNGLLKRRQNNRNTPFSWLKTTSTGTCHGGSFKFNKAFPCSFQISLSTTDTLPSVYPCSNTEEEQSIEILQCINFCPNVRECTIRHYRFEILKKKKAKKKKRFPYTLYIISQISIPCHIYFL